MAALTGRRLKKEPPSVMAISSAPTITQPKVKAAGSLMGEIRYLSQMGSRTAKKD